ncbi:dephospho-CoA kinase [Rhodoferax sp.]|uniref:dephospho-CoA kinase n=1 Tax=Rhodoferax sp. TaxID=50421 RepID=UPI00276CB2AA|nr:dephospho-CoA kinase [Rhodoferax sp.]
MSAPAMRLAITGGIGSGKSTVARLFVDRGATLIDADALSRELTASGGAAIAPIVSVFGTSVLTQDGALDRNAMRAIAYTDAQARRALEHIIHPLVAQLVSERGSRAERAGGTCVVYDIPLLAESAIWRQRVDRVLVVDCSEETQISRVANRSQLNRQAIESIIAVQATRERRLRCADSVIDNSQLSLEQLSREVADLADSFGL